MKTLLNINEVTVVTRRRVCPNAGDCCHHAEFEIWVPHVRVCFLERPIDMQMAGSELLLLCHGYFIYSLSSILFRCYCVKYINVVLNTMSV